MYSEKKFGNVRLSENYYRLSKFCLFVSAQKTQSFSGLEYGLGLGLGARENLLESNKFFAELNVVKFYISRSGD